MSAALKRAAASACALALRGRSGRLHFVLGDQAVMVGVEILEHLLGSLFVGGVHFVFADGAVVVGVEAGEPVATR